MLVFGWLSCIMSFLHFLHLEIKIDARRPLCLASWIVNPEDNATALLLCPMTMVGTFCYSEFYTSLTSVFGKVWWWGRFNMTKFMMTMLMTILMMMMSFKENSTALPDDNCGKILLLRMLYFLNIGFLEKFGDEEDLIWQCSWWQCSWRCWWRWWLLNKMQQLCPLTMVGSFCYSEFYTSSTSFFFEKRLMGKFWWWGRFNLTMFMMTMITTMMTMMTFKENALPDDNCGKILLLSILYFPVVGFQIRWLAV